MLKLPDPKRFEIENSDGPTIDYFYIFAGLHSPEATVNFVVDGKLRSYACSRRVLVKIAKESCGALFAMEPGK